MKDSQDSLLFGKKNYLWMTAGIVLIAVGFLLMSGGGNPEPGVYNPEIYSLRRILLAPAVVLAGFGVEVYAIFLSPVKKDKK